LDAGGLVDPVISIPHISNGHEEELGEDDLVI